MDYKGKTYQLKELNLKTKTVLYKLIAKLRKLNFEYTKDLDFSILNDYEAQRGIWVTAKTQNDVNLERGTDSEGKPINVEAVTAHNKSLEEKISKLDSDFENNLEAQALIRIKGDLDGLALLELISDEKFIKPILKEVLIGDDFELDNEALPFVAEVISNFFLQNKLKMQK